MSAYEISREEIKGLKPLARDIKRLNMTVGQCKTFIIVEKVKTCKVKPKLTTHDHEEYFSKRVRCGHCGELIGSWNFGRLWYDGDDKKFKEAHRCCPHCQTEIDWGNDMGEIIMPEVKSKSTKEAYTDITQEMIDYIKSLPEYNDEIFKVITGKE